MCEVISRTGTGQSPADAGRMQAAREEEEEGEEEAEATLT